MRHFDADLAAWQQRPVVETTIPATTLAVVPIDELRAHVAQPLPDDDLILQAVESAAQAVVATWLGRPILACTRRAWFDGEIGDVVRLSEPATAVSAVTSYALDGEASTVVAAGVYTVDLTSVPARILKRSGESWPTSLRRRLSFAVTYTSGWAAPEVPEAVRQAIKLLVGHWYEQRQAVTFGAANDLPLGIQALLMPYRIATGVA